MRRLFDFNGYRAGGKAFGFGAEGCGAFLTQGLDDGKAAAIKGFSHGTLMQFVAGGIGIVQADDGGRAGQGEGHEVLGVRDADAGGVHDAEFDMADVFAIGGEGVGVTDQFDCGGLAGGLEIELADGGAVLAAHGLEGAGLEGDLPA